MGFAHKNWIFCPLSQTKLTNIFLAGNAHATSSHHHRGRLKTWIAARQTRYDRFQTTFYCEFEYNTRRSRSVGSAHENQDILPLAPNKIDRYISRGQSPYHLFPLFPSSSRSSENANRSHRMENALFRRPLQFLSHSPICYNPPLNFYLFRKNHELEMRHRRPAQCRQIHPL